ncbi:hypothetical protein EOS_17170 [Caballeronia mineralivorans PML1(12)]|uniref:Lipoprotein n=1 Tax=Caballeronia mineralivorans PML1(12) TaxID=908627 RepID=A0A0J1CXH5_9BURK|nr:DUF3313 domain-containing protein [Caballeronia mineralivorans]KLU25056.1 hypothetical protein EOS_17170 [Caballeronia mineralivorans PML1(12)]
MNLIKNLRPLLCGIAFFSLVGCAGVQPVPYSGIPSSSYLKPNAQDDSSRVPYRYSTAVNWRSYSNVMVDPVEIYDGKDSQFGNLSDEDKAALAEYLRTTFMKKLGTMFEPTVKAAPGTLRVKLILTGAESTKLVAGQVTHFDIFGNIYNGVQAVRGEKSAFGGSVSYVVEIYDASNNKLLNAYLTRQYPNAMNITASFGSLGAAKVGVDKGADALLAQLR